MESYYGRSLWVIITEILDFLPKTGFPVFVEPGEFESIS